MFKDSAGIGCDFPAYRGGFAKCEQSLIFHQPSLTLEPDHCDTHLETGFSSLSTFCCSYFHTCPLLLPSCQETLASLFSQVTGHNSLTGVLCPQKAVH